MSPLFRQLVHICLAIVTFIVGVSIQLIWSKPVSPPPARHQREVRYPAEPPIALIPNAENGGRRCLAHTLYYPDAASEREFGGGEPGITNRYCAKLQVQLDQAVEKDDLDGVRNALALGANPNSPGEYYWLNYPLDRASKYRSLTLVKLLLDNGAEVDGRDASCTGCGSPLVSAVDRNDVEMVRLLLERGARTHYVEYLGDRTARAIAEGNGNREIMELLDRRDARE